MAVLHLIHLPFPTNSGNFGATVKQIMEKTRGSCLLISLFTTTKPSSSPCCHFFRSQKGSFACNSQFLKLNKSFNCLRSFGNKQPPSFSVQALNKKEESNATSFQEFNEFVVPKQKRVDEPPNTQFVKALTELYPPLPCRFCRGSLSLPCERCEGRGNLSRGGYQKRNPISLDRIIGSKWTAMERTFGWRHFRVCSKTKGQGKEWFLEMVATCDETSRFWVNAQNLKDRERWGMGWLQRVEIDAALQGAEGSRMTCKNCKGEGHVVCRSCSKKTRTIGVNEGLEIIEI